MFIFYKAIIPGGAGGDLFATPVQVQGYARGGKFIAPHQAVRHKRTIDEKLARLKARRDPDGIEPDLFSAPKQPEKQDELIREHERLVDVLRSPSHEDDKAEAKRQAAELAEMKAEKAEAKPEPKAPRWRALHQLSAGDAAMLRERLQAIAPGARVLRGVGGRPGLVRLFAKPEKTGPDGRAGAFTDDQVEQITAMLRELGYGTTLGAHTKGETFGNGHGFFDVGRLETDQAAAPASLPNPEPKPKAPPPAPKPAAKPPMQTAKETAAVAAKDAKQREAQATKLRALADKDIAAAEESMGRDRNTNTHRRANMAAGAISNALRQKQIAETMKNLADAIEYGEARHLEGVTSRAAVEALETELRQGKYRRIRAENRGGLPEREIEKPISADDIRSARLPNARVDSYDSRGLLNAAEQRGVSRGHARILEWLRGSLRSQDGWTPDSADLERLVALVDAIEKKGMPSDHRYAADRIKSIARERGRFARMGIRSDLDLQEALAEYVQFRAGRASEDPIKKAERELVGFQGLDFFPTPPALVDELVKEADIQPGMKVLEPSAGKGDIADAIRRLGGDVDTVELAEPLRRILEAKKHRIVGSDFTAFEAPAGGYDRIVMNPPFSNGMDADHVRLAFDMLKPGGRLVAITGEGIHFRSDAKARGFREWLEELGATATKLPEGSFKSAFRPTGVATRLVVIDKDADAPAVSGATIKPDLKVAEAPAAEEGPKEGDTKTEGGVAYVLRDGRWHRADPEPEAPASDITSPEVMPPPAPATFDQAVERAGAEPFAAGDLNWQGGYADDALDQLHARPDDFAMTTDGRWQRMEHYLARTDRTDEITRLSDAITGDHPEAHRSRWKRQLRRLADAMADQAPAPAPEPAPAPAEPAGPWEGFAKPEEYHTDRARESYGAISFSPEKRARSDRDSYVQDVNGLYQELYKLAETDEQKAVLAREMEAYRQAYLRHDAAVASARGRTMSPMITGGSNFPVHRNEKALRSEHNRIGEFLDWHKRARAAIRARLAGARTADQVRDDLWAMLRKDLTGSLATIAGIDMKADGYRGYDRSAFTSSVIAKLRRLAERGETDLLQRALDYIKAGQAKLPKPMFNDRSPIWQLMPAAETKATAQDAEPAGDQVVAEKDGVQVIRASSIGRVQIHFPGKPDEAMRAQLKGAGWRWSPSNSAWQRMDTDASVASAKRIIGA